MYKEIGAFDAKARFSELLRSVSEGQSYTISVRGKPIADLVPSLASRQADVKAAMEALRNFPRVKGVKDEDIAAMIREGRE